MTKYFAANLKNREIYVPEMEVLESTLNFGKILPRIMLIVRYLVFCLGT